MDLKVHSTGLGVSRCLALLGMTFGWFGGVGWWGGFFGGSGWLVGGSGEVGFGGCGWFDEGGSFWLGVGLFLVEQV